MRLLEAIVDANHRALAGDERAGLRPADFAGSLPVVVLTCFDPRLHALMPEVLGVSERDFLWLTNAGAVVTRPQSETARAVALACGVEGGREVVVLGHTGCRFFGPDRRAAADWFRQNGADLSAAATELDDFLRPLFNERSSVATAVGHLRASPFLPLAIPVHGLIVDTDTGRLDWVVNGYGSSGPPARQAPLPPAGAGLP